MSEAPTIDRSPRSAGSVDLLAGISVRLSVEVGSTAMTLSELAALEIGSIIALDRKVGEPLDICANGSPIARGEIISIDGRYGIRITELLSGAQSVAGRL